MPAGERLLRTQPPDPRLWSTTVRKGRRGKGKRPGPAVHDDYLRRDFTAEAPNRKWLTDIIGHPTITAGRIYCCAIEHLFSNRIVGYAIDERMTAQLAAMESFWALPQKNVVYRRRWRTRDEASPRHAQPPLVEEGGR